MFELLDELPPVPADLRWHYTNANGKVCAAQCTAMLAQYDEDQFADLVKKIQADELTDRMIADQVLVDWADVVKGGSQLDFTPENKARLLRQPGVATAIVRKFFDMRKDLLAAPEKNSASSASTSPGAQPA